MKYPGFIKVAYRELGMSYRNPSVRNLMLIVPVVVFILLAFIYIEGALQKIPVAVYDQDNSKLSRTLIDFINSTPSMKVTYYINSHDDLDDFFLKHKEHAIFRIPNGMERDVMKGKATRVITYTNSSNIVFGNILLREAYTVVGTLSAGATIERLIATGLSEKQAMDLAVPINIDSKPLFNPIYNYLYYLVPGLMTVLLQMIVFFIATRSINIEYTNHTFGKLIEISNGKAINIVVGKALIYLAHGLAISLFIGLLFVVFGIPFRDKEFELLVLFSVFILSNIMLGMMLSATLDDELLALDIAFFYNSPAFVFSGFTFPMFGMPFFDSVYAQFIPYTHFLYGFFKVYQIGAPFGMIRPEIIALLIFMLTGFVTTWIALRIRINQNRVKNLAVSI